MVFAQFHFIYFSQQMQAANLLSDPVTYAKGIKCPIWQMVTIFEEINGDSDVGDMKLVIFYNVGDRIYILVTAFE